MLGLRLDRHRPLAPLNGAGEDHSFVFEESAGERRRPSSAGRSCRRRVMKSFLAFKPLGELSGKETGSCLQVMTGLPVETNSTGGSPFWARASPVCRDPDGRLPTPNKAAVPLKLKSVEQRENGALWTRYEVAVVQPEGTG